MDLKKRLGGLGWIRLTKCRDEQRGFCEHTNELPGFIESTEFSRELLAFQ
jgi:hypothetical protein